MRPAVLMLLSCAAVAGCRGAPGNGQNGQIRMANEHHEALMKLSPGYQRIGIRRAVHDAGYRSHCTDVINTGYQEEYQNLRMWVAECGPQQRSYAVYIAPNGDVQVRDCADAEELKLPVCKGLPPPVADPTVPQVQKGASNEAYRQRPATPDER